MTSHEAEYRVEEQTDSKINLVIWVDGRDEPIRHGVPIKQARESKKSVQEYIEDSVERIASKHHQDTFDETDLPDSGKVGYERDEPAEPPSKSER